MKSRPLACGLPAVCLSCEPPLIANQLNAGGRSRVATPSPNPQVARLYAIEKGYIFCR